MRFSPENFPPTDIRVAEVDRRFNIPGATLVVVLQRSPEPIDDIDENGRYRGTWPRRV